MLAAEANDAGIVVHLHVDHDVIRGLHDLVVVVVEHRQHRRPTGGSEADHAALAQGALLRAVEGVDDVAHEIDELDAGAEAVRQFAAAWRSDDRAARLAVHPQRPSAWVHPKGVVAADILASLEPPFRDVVDGLKEPRCPPLPLRRFGFGQHQAVELIGALQGGDGGVGPGALQVGMAEVGARRSKGLGMGGGAEDCDA